MFRRMERLFHEPTDTYEEHMLTIESTADCGQTPRLLFLLEDLGAPYELTLRPESYFMEMDGRPGPRVRDGELELHIALTAFRYLARTRGGGRLLAGTAEQVARIEQWIDEAWVALGIFVMMLVQARRADKPAEIAEHAINRTLTSLDEALATSPFVVGDFSAADCALSGLGQLKRLVDLSPFPNVERYATELSDHPAFRRAQRALAGISTPDAVLDFWFGEPIRTEEDISEKIQRWFLSGRALDEEIRTRFTATLDAAIAGGLGDWTETPKGSLALVVLLDQFSRHIRRDSAAAFEGDPLALAVALESISRGDLDALGLHEHRHFLTMPLHHAENLEMQQLHGRLVEDNACIAPAHLSKMVAAGREQTAKYQTIIARFGRFPHRNEVLGRETTVEEATFLSEFMAQAPPEIARQIAASR